jgi:hypothetical protein
MELDQFSKIAPYLINPLVLIGFCLFLLFGTHQVLLKAGIVSPLSSRQSSAVVLMILRQGFWISILIIVLGFLYAGFRFHQDAKNREGSVIQETGSCGSNISGNNNQAAVDCGDKKAGTK